MKTVLLLLLILTSVRGSEITFEVVFDEAPKDQASHEYQVRFLLETYDVFSAAVREGVVKWRDSHGDREVRIEGAQLFCDVRARTLRVQFTKHLSADALQVISDALIGAVAAKFRLPSERVAEEVAKLKAKLEAGMRAIDAEKDPSRRRILEELFGHIYINDSSPRFPLRLRQSG